MQRLLDTVTIMVLGVIIAAGILEVFKVTGFLPLESHVMMDTLFIISSLMVVCAFPLYRVFIAHDTVFEQPAVFLGFSAIIIGLLTLILSQETPWLSVLSKELLGGVLLLLHWEHRQNPSKIFYTSES
ncbi:MAG: hypothetical protein AAGB12_03235 [Pseudomonadota bacterium]